MIVMFALHWMLALLPFVVAIPNYASSETGCSLRHAGPNGRYLCPSPHVAKSHVTLLDAPCRVVMNSIGQSGKYSIKFVEGNTVLYLSVDSNQSVRTVAYERADELFSIVEYDRSGSVQIVHDSNKTLTVNSENSITMMSADSSDSFDIVPFINLEYLALATTIGPSTPPSNSDPVVFMLIGTTGVGKSTIANLVLSENGCGRPFAENEQLSRYTTTAVQCVSCSSTHQSRSFTICDTPGLDDPRFTGYHRQYLERAFEIVVQYAGPIAKSFMLKVIPKCVVNLVKNS